MSNQFDGRFATNVPMVMKVALPSPAVAVAPPELNLQSLNGQGYPLRDWLTSFPLVLVALDPYTHESAWILETAGQILDHYTPADIRTGWVVTADEQGCRQFLGPWADRFLTFPDLDRKIVKELQVERAPALIHVRSDGYLEVANGWDPDGWRDIADTLKKILSWSRPTIPKPGDPVPYAGTPAIGG